MPESPREAYARRAAGAADELVRLDRTSALLANLRTVTFLAVVGLTVAVAFQRLPRVALWGAVANALAFVALAVVHARVIRDEAKARVRKGLNERGLLRLDGRWHEFADTGAGELPESHLYAGDLDVIGKGSLCQRLDETGTLAGHRQLVSWLAQPAATAAEIRHRQGAVRELAPMVDFRQALVTEARMASSAKADPSAFIAWAEATSGLDAIRWAFPLAHLLAPFSVLTGVGAALDALPSTWFYAGLAANIAVVLLTRGPLNRLWAALTLGERGLVRFEETFRAIDEAVFVHARLVHLQRGLQAEGGRVTERVRRFARVMGFAELKASPQLHPIINALTLWDVLVLFRVEAWRVRDGRGVRQWFEALAQLEALASFAGLAFEQPDFCFPEVDDGPGHLVASQLGHPLLRAPVTNDVEWQRTGQALIITGSNMSGKTTLMRAVGLNAVMGLAGLPVCAKALRLSPMQVVTSMRVKDSLERGTSYFYAEVQRVKSLLDAAAAHRGQCLFLLDELFMGTNTRERQLASKHLLRVLLDHGAIGAVTTHDLTLCELDAERPGDVRNVHFRDVMAEGSMTFDYRLRDGVVTTTNALEVLRQVGIVVEVPPAVRLPPST